MINQNQVFNDENFNENSFFWMRKKLNLKIGDFFGGRRTERFDEMSGEIQDSKGMTGNIL